MKQRYAIVGATASHLTAVPRIELASSTLFSERDLPAELRYRVTDQETLKRAQNEGRLWIALVNKTTAAGFAMATCLDGVAHLDELDVMPAYGRQGIGTHLVKAVIDWAVTGGHAMLTLVTFRHIPWNAPFYGRLGFEPCADALLGKEMRQLLAEERAAGIRIENRQVMIKRLP